MSDPGNGGGAVGGPCAPGSECDEVLVQLETYLDHELSDAELVERMARHLGDCSPCKDRADLETCVRELLRSRCVERAPTSLVARLEGLLGQQAGA